LKVSEFEARNKNKQQQQRKAKIITDSNYFNHKEQQQNIYKLQEK
jgi:hypothetical protein